MVSFQGVEFPKACSGWVSPGICVCNILRCGGGSCALGRSEFGLKVSFLSRPFSRQFCWQLWLAASGPEFLRLYWEALLGGGHSFRPPMAFFPLSDGQVISVIAYLITCLIIVWAAEHYRRLTKRLEDEQNFRELAVEELAHRLKNKVATIQSIVSLRLREDPQARDEIVNCLGSLRATDDLIIAAQGQRRSHSRYTLCRTPSL